MTIVISQIQTNRESLEQTLVKHRGNYYVVSRSTRMPPWLSDTHIFRSDEDGNITDWEEVGSARCSKLSEVIQSMDDYMYKNYGW